jgi:hypothetical protein
MAQYVMVVLSEPKDGRDDEYNDWYTNRHLREVLQVPGFVAAQRFKVAGSPTGKSPPQGYMALYTVEAESWQAAAELLGKTVGSGAIYMSDAINLPTVQSFYVEPITEQLQSA